MIDIDRRTATLFALLAPFAAASAAAAQSELPHKMPELGKGTDRDMTKVPWMGNEVIAMLVYALGRGLPTMVTVRKGASLPFDIATFSGLHWATSGTAEDRRRAFREHWIAIRNRPSLVPAEPLIS